MAERDTPKRFIGIAGGRDADDAHGDTVVFAIEIAIRRNGAMSVSGAINDEQYALLVLDSARDSIRSYHARKRLSGQGGTIVVPACDTALVGTEQEKALLSARDDLANAMTRGK
jgi:hypothetical protein